MNPVNATDVTLLTLAMADFTLLTDYLVKHDYAVAGGLLVVGVIFNYLYHRYGSPSIPVA